MNAYPDIRLDGADVGNLGQLARMAQRTGDGLDAVQRAPGWGWTRIYLGVRAVWRRRQNRDGRRNG
ncbi:hypothetical protein LJK88_48765 [Paenibacillus sp. P26]|nr:hypothetical protein LJK88_48765 [Paenibacillus sp. P26]